MSKSVYDKIKIRPSFARSYFYLISNFKPVEIKFANQIIENGEVSLQIIGNLEEKKKIYDLFKKKMNNN